MGSQNCPLDVISREKGDGPREEKRAKREGSRIISSAPLLDTSGQSKKERKRRLYRSHNNEKARACYAQVTRNNHNGGKRIDFHGAHEHGMIKEGEKRLINTNIADV